MKNSIFTFFLIISIRLIAQDSISSKLNGAWILSDVRLDNTLLDSEYPDPLVFRAFLGH